MSGFPALVAFDSADTRLFMSVALSNRFDDALGDLDYLLEVEISNLLSVSVIESSSGL